jgi:hypothetical protein
MAKLSIVELAEAAAARDEPAFVTELNTNFGNIDPLGMRQINFDLMDQVFPGLNNAARHVRPFVIVAWSWRQALKLAKESGAKKIKVPALQDYVDRVEVMFALSQFLQDRKSDLPGGEFLAPLLQEEKITFGGSAWEKRRAKRESSTALSAPVSYGPGLKMLGWIRPHPEYRNVMLPTTEAIAALDALEAVLRPALKHEAFNSLGSVTVTRAELVKWGKLWPLDKPTSAESKVMRDLLLGPNAPLERQMGMTLLRAAAAHSKSTEVHILREIMCGPPARFRPQPDLIAIRDSWRRLQVRQLFRFSLESLFYWVMLTLESHQRSIDELVNTFLKRVPSTAASNARDWLKGQLSSARGPTTMLDRIQQVLAERNEPALPQAIAAGIACCLNEPIAREPFPQQAERLPLSRARAEADARASDSVAEFMRHVIESWVLAQHAYWSVGRGLADARAGGKMLLRLRVILDEGGWSLTPGAAVGNVPRPTPDRLQTAITLAQECGFLEAGR